MQFTNMTIMICILFILIIAVISYLPELPFNELQPNLIRCSNDVRLFSGCESVIESESLVRPGKQSVSTSVGKQKCNDMFF